MAQDRPARLLEDVRYFESAEPPQRGQRFPAYAGSLFDVPAGATALGERIARRCGQLDVSIGRASQLYLCLTASLPDGAIALSDRAAEAWHQVVLHGLDPATFNALSQPEKMAVLGRATFAVLRALAPAMANVLDGVQAEIAAAGEAFRLTLKSKTTKHYALVVEQTIPAHPQPTEVFVRAVHLATGAERVQKLGEAQFPSMAPSLVDRLAVTGEILTVHPRKSFRAQLDNARSQPLATADLGALFSS